MDDVEQKQVELEGRAWFRFLKVIYIVGIVISILVVGVFAWSLKPTQVVDYDKSYFKCNNDPDNIYLLGKNNIYLNYSDVLYDTDDRRTKSTCRNDKTIDFIPDEKNYTLTIAHKNSYSYKSWLGYTALAFFGVWLFFKLVSTAFFYIAVGKKPNFSKNL